MVREILGDEVCVCVAGARFLSRLSTVGAFPLALQSVRGDSGQINNQCAADWRADLDASRDLSDLEKQDYGFLLSRFESWRVRQRLEPGRAARSMKVWRRWLPSKSVHSSMLATRN